jgi:ABC-type transport system involved in multi-copper enzyme maturation permease subunit
MTFLPIVERELRVAARRKNTFWTRMAVALLATMLTLPLLATAFFPLPVNAGEMIFGALSGALFAYCLLGGILKTTDCLSEEKREGTLGLLFLTDLSGYDVVLGKMAATSLNWAYGLLAAFPILATTLLLGGVTAGEFWRTILALLNLLFVSLAAGMFVSSISRQERKAMVGTVLALFLLFYVPTWLGKFHQSATNAREVSPVFLAFSPGRPFSTASDGLYARQANQFWCSLLASNLVGWGLLGLAGYSIRRTWQEKATSARAFRWQALRRQWRFGKPRVREAFRKRLLAVNPFFWLAARDLRVPPALTGIQMAACGLLLWTIWAETTSARQIALTYIWPAAILQFVLKVCVAAAACRRFVEDRRSGTPELVLVTPLSVPEILRGQWRALRAQYFGPMVVLLLFDLWVLLIGLSESKPGGAFEARTLALTLLASTTIFLTDLFALGWLSMWLGLTSNHAFRAISLSALLILVLPWMGFFVAIVAGARLVLPFIVASPALKAGSVPFYMRPEVFIGLWFVPALAADLIFGLWARGKLYREFRARAARPIPFAKPPSLPTPPPAAAVHP